MSIPATAGWPHVAETKPRDSGTTHTSAPASVRAATAEDLSAILRLIATSYDRQDDLARLHYWQWKHEANPFGPSPCLVAEAGPTLVGVRVFLRWTWRSGDRDIQAVRAVDTATHPEWRGQGIFSRLTMRLVEEMQQGGVSFVYNTPNDKSMPGYLKMGWSSVTRIPLWVRPLGLPGALRMALSGGAPTAPLISSLEPIDAVLRDPRLPAFLSDVAPVDDRYHTARTLAYLRWRYRDIPGHTYRAAFDMSGDAGALLIARGRTRGRLREVTISELLVTPSERGIQLARNLLSNLARSADADYIAACSAAGTAERRALGRARFVPAPRVGPHFTARRLAPEGPDPLQWSSWRCSIGDLEIF
jgi:GNAT superfamily N-acetyltransferase